ncbi:hypothetical protein TL16_g00272 [Triparma laevis f. inornata]|uniref:Prolycopene isomerase n=1 Tax=Triparma laevis f. inornata TaxID=1714386 RepID=A0A9W7DMC3_9STRA|nr:hypothetical protein TL16_g00272 [Triparma laevis f. inornata]
MAPNPPNYKMYAAGSAAFVVSFVTFKLLRFTLSKRQTEPADLLDAVKKLEGLEDQNVRTAFSKARYQKALKKKNCEDFDVVFVGGGLGTLACAAALARTGKKCLLLEQGDQLGGGAHVFSVPGGFEFETGVHYLGNDIKMEKLLNFLSCGRLVLDGIGTPIPDAVFQASSDQLDMAEGQPAKGAEKTSMMYDQIVIDGENFPFVAGKENLRTMLKARFPAQTDHVKIDAFFKVLDDFSGTKVQEQVTMFFRLKCVSLLSMWLRDKLQRLLCGSFLKYAHMTSEDMLRHCDIDPESKLGMVVLGQYGDAGMRPDKASALIQLGVMLHYMEGSTYPRGGSGAIPRKLNNVILAAGGKSFVHARCTELLFNDSSTPTCIGVKVNGVTDIFAKTIVSGIGVGRTYRDLIATHVDKRISAMAVQPLERIYKKPENCENSVAFIFLFVGLDVTNQPSSERDDRNHNTWYYPDFPDGLDGYTKMEQRVYGKDGEGAGEPWSRPMPYFAASGSSKDSIYSEKFPGKKTVVILSQCPWDWVKEWQDIPKAEREKNSDYQKFTQQTEDFLMENCFRKTFPKLEKYVVHKSIGTPLSTNTWLGTDEGECYGQGLTPQHLHLPDMIPTSNVKNLFMTGQDVCTLGVSGAMNAGYITANAIAGFGCWENAILQGDLVLSLGLPGII